MMRAMVTRRAMMAGTVVTRRTMVAGTVVRTPVATTAPRAFGAKQALAELSRSKRQQLSGHVWQVVGKHLDMHASMLGVDLHHDVAMTILTLAGLA
jgi:hypothetical protein